MSIKSQISNVVYNKIQTEVIPEIFVDKLNSEKLVKIITQGIAKNQSVDEMTEKAFKKLPKTLQTDQNRQDLNQLISHSVLLALPDLENLDVGKKYTQKHPETQAATDVSDKGVAFIANYEQFKGLPYDDKTGKVITDFDSKVGVVTVGYGHAIFTKAEFEKYKNGISQEDGAKLFKQDLKKYVDAVNEQVKVPLTQNQFDALVSFTYNIGTGSANDGKKVGLLDSKVLALVNSGDANSDSFTKAFAAKNTAGGVVMDGLKLRRKDESEIFLNGEYNRTPQSWLQNKI